MAAPVQQQEMQPPQYEHIQQQPVQEQSRRTIQAQPTQQPQIVRSQPTRQGCCSPHGKALSIIFHPVQFALGICMILNGVTGVIFGIVGIFTTRYVYHGYNFYRIYHNPTAWVGANIWGGMFVSVDRTTSLV